MIEGGDGEYILLTGKRGGDLCFIFGWHAIHLKEKSLNDYEKSKNQTFLTSLKTSFKILKV